MLAVSRNGNCLPLSQLDNVTPSTKDVTMKALPPSRPDFVDGDNVGMLKLSCWRELLERTVQDQTPRSRSVEL